MDTTDTMDIKKQRDLEVLTMLRDARDAATKVVVDNGLGFPSWLGDISYALGYFEGRCGVFTGGEN